MEKMPAASLANLVRMAQGSACRASPQSSPSVGPKGQPGDLASRK